MIKKSLYALSLLCVLALCFLLISNRVIENTTKDLVYTDVNNIPHHRVGLLLGTSKSLSSGQPNLYFSYRIAAAVDLWQAQKIDVLVISGDNSLAYYNEPEDMKKELIKRGIPSEKIYLDYAGFRTYDSMVRLDKIFGQKDCIVISQDFHNRRAIYIARELGLNAIGYNAKDVNAHYGFKTQLREKFARAKVFLDLWFDKEPKFLGEKVQINS